MLNGQSCWQSLARGSALIIAVLVVQANLQTSFADIVYLKTGGVMRGVIQHLWAAE